MLTFILNELQVPIVVLAIICCNNMSTTHLAANPIMHAHTKHVEMDHHFVHDKVVDGSLLVRFVPFEEQLADVMAKPLPSQHFVFQK